MANIMKTIGVNSIKIKISIDSLQIQTLPCIVQFWDGQFAVVQYKYDAFIVAYPGQEPFSLSKNLFKGLYTGYALILSDGKSPLPKPDTTGPDLAVENYCFDVGIKNESELIEHIFVITNQGTKPLNLTRVRPTCACVSATITTNVLQPGEHGKVHVRFDTRGRFGKQSEGVFLHSDDPITPLVPLRLSGVLQSSALTVSQRSVDFGVLRAAQGGSTELTLSDRAAPAFQVKEASCPSPSVKCAILPPDKEHAAYRLSITLMPGIPVGAFAASLMVTTTHHKEATLTLPLRATILPNLDLQPELVHFGRVKQGGTATKQLVLTLYATAPWKIERLTMPVDYVTVEQAPQNKESITLTFRLTEKAPVGVLKTQLVIQTTHPEYKEITIPVYGVVEE